MEVTKVNISGKETGKAKLPTSIFGIEPNDHAIYLDVKSYLAAQRQGTHKAKERAEITGSTKKIKKQKGTGTARAGSIKSPVFKGGGRVFGPRPRNYGFKLNKKVKELARKSALAYKAKDKNISILEKFDWKETKTKEFAKALGNLKLSEVKSLFIIPESNTNLHLSSRNVKNSKVVTVNNLNTFEIMNADQLLFVEGSVEKLESLLS